MVIIGLWAAVLIPIWLKRQDQVSEVRSTARFSSAMRSLGDRADTTSGTSGRSETHVRDFTSPRDRARAQAAKRRSLILAALTSITALALIGTVLGFIPAFVPIGAGVLLAAFLVTTMLTASKRDQAPVRKSARAYREFHEVESPREVVDYERPLTRAELQKAELDDFANWDPWDEGRDARLGCRSPDSAQLRERTPSDAVPRNIERNGDWSGESMVDMVAQSRVAQP